MRGYGKQTEVMFDWFVPFYERAIPKDNPKKPIKDCVAWAAQVAYDDDPVAMPFKFFDGLPMKALSRKELRAIAIHRITEWAIENRARLHRYMLEYYDVLVVWHDGEPSKGIRIVVNRSSEENVAAAQRQGAWFEAHCQGTHDCEDFEAEQINRLQPKAALQRHKLVMLPLPKPGGKK